MDCQFKEHPCDFGTKRDGSLAKLIRVLTHEIMNSITPIISLAETLSERCKEYPEEIRNRQHLQQGLNIIRRRSKGLLEFVENTETHPHRSAG
mgnify:CR=1 FL=1